MKALSRRNKFGLILMSGSILISGCGTNPYVRTAGMQTSLPSPSAATPLRFAGDLEQAIRDVDGQRTAYYERLEKRTDQRNFLSGSLIGLSAAALYKGVTASAGASNRAVLNFGALAGGAYALGSYSNSPNTELAYITAANDLTCLVLRTRPWLLTTTEFDKFTASATALADSTNVLDALFQKQAAQSGDSRKFVANHNFEKRILYNARVTLRKASNLKGFVETAGFQLRQEAILASNVANFEIHRLQPELASPSTALTGMRSTSQAFRDIKPLDVAPAEAQKDEDDKSSDTTTTSPVAETADKSVAAAKKTPPDTPTATSDLGKEADKLNKQLKDQAELLVVQKKSNETAAKNTKKEMARLDKKLDDINKAIAAIKAGETAKLTVVVTTLTTTDAIELAEALSDVLAAMRPVNAVLTRAYSLKPYVKSIPQCQPLNAQVFEFVFESDEVTLSPGQSFEVAVKGGVGVPRIWMSGAKGNDKGEMPLFATTIDGGIARAKLTTLASTPPGEMYIAAVDGSGKQRDEIKVIVVAVPEKK